MATLTRASAFLSAGLRAPRAGCGPLSIEGPMRVKVLANSLRELDRLLSLLIDEAALFVAPEGFDHAAFARLRNTPNKLSRLHVALALPPSRHERLRAVGRSRNCLFHCGGVVMRGSGIDGSNISQKMPEIDYENHASGQFRIGDDLIVSVDDLQNVCALYDQIGFQLIEACGVNFRKH